MSRTSKTSDDAAEARRRLFARQEALLRHLTRPEAYESPSGQALDPLLRGLDADRLRLIGRLSLTKRLNKVETFLPATLHCLRHHAPDLLSAFASQCPPVSAGRYANALQFQEFLVGVLERENRRPAYLRDLVRCEFVAAACAWDHRRRTDPGPARRALPPDGTVRVRSSEGLKFLAYQYNVRDLMRDPSATPPASLPRSPGRLVILAHPRGPRLFEISEDVEDLLRSLEQWTPLRIVPGEGGLSDVLVVLHESGMIEVDPCASA